MTDETTGGAGGPPSPDLAGTATPGPSPRSDQKPPKTSSRSWLPSRAPIQLPGLAWLAVALGPWIVYWILAGLLPGWWWLDILVALVLGLVVLGYRFFYLKVTWWDLATPIYFALIFILCTLGPSGRIALFIPFGSALSYIVLGGLWLTTLLRPIPLTLAYTPVTEGQPPDEQVRRLHEVTTVVWGLVFLLSAVLCLAANIPGHAVVWTLVRYLLLLMAAVFTVVYLNWYPQVIANRRKRE
jgi:hypothetical protein